MPRRSETENSKSFSFLHKPVTFNWHDSLECSRALPRLRAQKYQPESCYRLTASVLLSCMSSSDTYRMACSQLTIVVAATSAPRSHQTRPCKSEYNLPHSEHQKIGPTNLWYVLTTWLTVTHKILKAINDGLSQSSSSPSLSLPSSSPPLFRNTVS